MGMVTGHEVRRGDVFLVALEPARGAEIRKTMRLDALLLVSCCCLLMGSCGGDDATPGSSARKAATPELYDVVQVIDGDTIRVNVQGSTESVRLIGINTPETGEGRRALECFGREASDFAERLMDGRRVRLEGDPTQDERDQYGRLLRYVWLDDGTFVNERMIAEGYAYEYTYDLPYRYRDDFRAAETQARSSEAGLWAPSACGWR